MLFAVVFQWTGSVRAALRSGQVVGNRLLAWDAKMSARGAPLFTYAERQLLGAGVALFVRLLDARVDA